MQMIEVEFQPEDRRAWVRAGSTLLAAAEAAGVDLATGCTEGMCGTDCVGVKADPGSLEPADGSELGSLERMGLDPESFRLACSARVREGRVLVQTDAF